MKVLDKDGVAELWQATKDYADSAVPLIDGTLTFGEDGKLGVAAPINGIYTQEEYDKLEEEDKNKGLFVIPGDNIDNRSNIYDIINATGSAIMHRNVYRGKFLGDHVTDEQFAAIHDSTFDDLYIGDYWTIGGVNWRIADFDYWYGKGDQECTTHHAVIVPDTNIATARMNSTNITTGGYPGSDIYTGKNSNVGLSTAKTTISNAFGSNHILSKRLLFANVVTNGKPSGGTWLDSTVDLMNEINVYGSYIVTPANDGTTMLYIYTTDTTQLSLFRLDPTRICNRAYWWLRDIVSAADFANVTSYGNAADNGASGSLGVRPAFGITGG